MEVWILERGSLKDIVARISGMGRMDFVEEAAVEQIADFERRFEVRLPERYKEWLRFSDGGELFLPGGVQLYGAAHEPVIDVRNEERPNEGYIVIGALANGDPILCERGTERISIFNLEAWRIEPDETYADFFEFLADLPDILGIEE